MFASDPGDVTVPTTGDATTTMKTYLLDQYGVKVGTSATGYTRNPSLDDTTGKSISYTSTAAASDTYTITVNNNAKMAGTTNQQTVTATAEYTFNGATKSATKTFTVTDYQLGVTLKPNTAHGGSGTDIAQNVYYGDHPTYSSGFSKTGYYIAGWSTNADTTAGTANCKPLSDYSITAAGGVYYAIWAPNTNTQYKVRHYWQNVTGSENTLHETTTHTGTSDATVTAPTKTYTGFNTPAAQSITIAADGSTIVNYYYTRKTYTVQFFNDGHRVSTQTVRYQGSATDPGFSDMKPASGDYHYNQTGWDTTFTNITANKDVNAVYTAVAHTWQTDSDVATCAHGSQTHKFCTVCEYLMIEDSGSEDSNNHEEQYLTYKFQSDNDKPTCTQNGTLKLYCTACQHFIDSDYTVNGNSYPATKTITKLGHDFVYSGANYTAPTCTTAGSAKCSRCAQTQTIAALGHSYDAGVKVDATCTATGTVTYTCQRTGCTASTTGHTMVTTIPKTPHTFTKDGTHHAATCTTPGYYEVICNVCNAAAGFNRYVTDEPAQGHNFVADTTYGTNGVSGGKIHLKCSRTGCTETKEFNLPDDVDASSVRWTVTEATCAATGTATMYYKVNGSSTEQHKDYTLPIDPDAHAGLETRVTAATCTATGSSRTYCTACSSWVDDAVTIPKLPHNYAMDKVDPTCTAAGYYQLKCSVCNATTGRVDIAALGHKWTMPGTITKTPNCTETGTVQYTCGRTGCTATTTETLPIVADAHAWGTTPAWTFGTPNATTGAMTATATFTCTHNGAHTKVITTTVYPTSCTATCTAAGVWNYSPSVTLDGTDYSTTTTKPAAVLGHDYSAQIASNAALKSAASCTAAAVYYYSCSRCSDIENDDNHTFTAGGPLGHNITVIDRVDPTCTVAGHNTYYYCERCHKYFDISDMSETTPAAQVINALDHHMETIEAVDATCETAGNNEYYRCIRCNNYYSDSQGNNATTPAAQVINALGHDWANGTTSWSWSKTASGYDATAIFTCHRNAGHQRAVTATVTKLSTSTEATCTAAGVDRFSASATLEGVTRTDTHDETLPALGHAYGAWTDNGNESTHIRTCANNSSHTETEAHDWIDLVDPAALVAASSNPCAAGVSYYKSCSVCGRISTDANNTFTTQTAGHKLVEVPAKAATCTENGNIQYWKCAVCGKYFNNADGAAAHEITAAQTTTTALGHSFDLTATPIEGTNGHMYPCTRCGGYGFGNALGNVEAHTFDQQNRGNRYLAGAATDCGQTATYYYSCVCGAVGTTTFSDPSGSLNHNLTAHPAVAATCAAEGRIAYWECSKCHRLFSDANGTTEVHADALSVPKTTNHTWGDWTTLTAATCTEQGSETRECSVCHKIETRTTNALQHDFANGTVYQTLNNGTHRVQCARTGCNVYDDPVACTNTTSTSTAADCQHQGTTTYTCSDCGGSWTVEGAYGTHNTTLVPAVTGDCTTAGTLAYYKCSVCGKMFSDAAGSGTEYTAASQLVVQPLGHALTLVAAVAATCTAGGHDAYYTCSRCNKLFRDALGRYEMESADEANTDALGHDWGDWSTQTAATCEGTGTKIHECARCHITETEPIPATGHAYPDAWTADGETGHKKVCGNNAGHVLSEAHTWENIVDPAKRVPGGTCATGIQYYKTCSVCGYTSTTQTFEVAAAGHQTVLIPAKTATCTEAGNSAYYKCSVCGLYFSDAAGTTEIAADSWVIPASGHDWDTTSPTWYWVKTDGGYNVMAVFTCRNNAEHQKSASAAATPTETQATCTTGGSVTWTASVTFEGATYTATPRTETVEQLGHDWSDWSVTTQATCDHAGVETRTCQRANCNARETRPIAQLTHKTVSVPAVAPTCTADGTIAHYTCALCGGNFSDAAGTASLASIVDPALGHNFDATGTPVEHGTGHYYKCTRCGEYGFNGVVGATTSHVYDQQNNGAIYAKDGSAADCTHQGEFYYSCACGANEHDDNHTFLAGGSLGHVLRHFAAVTATCKDDGNLEYWYCSRCGNYYSDANANTQTTLAAVTISHTTIAHTMPNTWTETVPATCTEDGLESRVCTVCGVYTETQAITALNHDFAHGTVYTSYNNGTHAVKCSRCDVVNPATENCADSKEIVSTTAADCIHLGTTTYRCTRCGYQWTEENIGVGPHSSTPVHHAAVAATCTTAGNVEYWTCELCGKNFSDEECTSEVADVTVAALAHAGIAAVAKQDADCTHDGVKAHFHCPLCGKDFSDATAAHEVNAEDLKIPMLGHNFYGAMRDNGDGTHSFQCTRCTEYGNPTAHTFDRPVVNDGAHVSDADCLNPAKYHYSCACGAIDTTGTQGTFDNGQPTGHAYNTVKANSWVWTVSGDSYTAKATLTCANDPTHEIERNAIVTYTSDAPSCTVAGTRHYTATVTLDNGSTATDTKDEEVAVVGHLWSAPTFTWSDDGKTCTATRSCERANCSATETETATVDNNKITSAVKIAATCTTMGVTTYTATFTNSAFAAQTKDVQDIPALTHDWGAPSYTWSDDGKTCTATRSCGRTGCGATETEIATVDNNKITSAVKTAATCTVMGTTTYTATFTNSAFEQQTKDVQDIAKTIHTLTETPAVTATCMVEGHDAYWTCSVCHKIFSDANGDHEIASVTTALDPDNHVTLVHTAKVDATCQTNGNIEYWTCNACHQKLVYNDAGKLVVTTDVVIPAGPEHHRFTTHVSAKAPTCTQQGNVEYWICLICSAKYNADKSAQLENNDASIPALGHDFTGDNGHKAAVAATCTTDGNKEYWYCARCHQYFLANSITAEPVLYSETVIPALTHSPSAEVAAVAASCTEAGNKAYTYCTRATCDAILTIDGVDVSLNGWTKTDNPEKYTIPALGHRYGEPTWTWEGNPADGYTSATATFVCANDNSHTVTLTDSELAVERIEPVHPENGKIIYTATVTFNGTDYSDTKEVAIVEGHHPVKVDAHDATCEAAGNREYWVCNDDGCGKLFLDANALVETTLADVTIPALGHNWVNPTWSWTPNGNLYSAATLTFTCSNNAEHTYVINADVTSETTAATCTAAGEIIFTATATTEAKDNLIVKTYTDTKVVELPTSGHTLTKTTANAADCTHDGNIEYWTCSVCNKIFSDAEAQHRIEAADTVIPALGHTYDYAHADYSWSSDHSSCTATATCIRCTATDTETKASTNVVKIAATCEAQGIRIYTADFVNENFATQTYDELIPANGHGTAVSHAGQANTCEAAGWEAYWTCSVCGKLFSDEELTNEIANPIVLPVLGHIWDYEHVDYDWSDSEPFTCTATVTCTRDESHTKEVTGSVTITASTEATCTADGSRVYTATFPADTNIPNDTKTATTEALGHDFTASIDRAHVVDETHHNYKCVRCAAYGIMDGEEAVADGSVACTFHGDWYVSENETCTSAGSEWRKCDFCSNTETREREALNHVVFSVAAKTATCVAIGNKAYTYCERCGLLLTVDGQNVESQNIKFNSEAAIALYKTEDMLNHDLTATGAVAETCETDGNIAYWTCSRCGKIFASAEPASNDDAITLEDTVLPATKHVFTGTARDNNDNTHSYKCTKCDAYGIMVIGTPVKNGKEACYGGTADCTNAAVCTVCGHTYQAKLGHDWVLQGWTWNGYTAATAHYVCTRNASHTKDVEATVAKTDATVTCTTAGQNTYVATATFTDDGITYTDTDTKTEVVNASGHNWDFANATYSWDANQNCTVTLICLNDEDHVYTEVGSNTTETTPATCEGTGSVKYTASFTINNTLTSEHTETLAALGHKWGDPAWTWTGNDTDGYTATVKLICDRVSSHEATPEVTVTKTVVAPTCEKDGRTVYTATATLDGRTYTDTKLTIQPALTHDWQAPVFTWTGNETDGYTAATALFACNNDHAHDQTLNCALSAESEDATCTSGGTVTYTATVTFNGVEYTDTAVAHVAQLGHRYELVNWTWTGDDENGYTAAVANFKCANDASHTATADATIATDPVPAICEADGKITYTATATFEGRTYTDVKTVVLPMLHHEWGDITYTWVKDGEQYKVTALRVCAHNPNEHQQTETVTTTSTITESSGCESEGTLLYTAAFHDPFTTQYKEEAVAVTGHTLVHVAYLEPTCTEIGNIEYWRCSVCHKIFTDELASSTSYIGTDLAETEIAAKGHDFVMEGDGVVAINNGDGTHSFKCSRCDVYGAVIGGTQTTLADGGKVAHIYGEWTVTKEPTCTEKGDKERVCSVCGDVETAKVDYKPHELYKVNAKPAYCSTSGNTEYYVCGVCGKLFTDETGATETSIEAVTIPALGHNFIGKIRDNGDGTHSFLCVNGCGSYGGKTAHVFDQQKADREYLRNYANCNEPNTYFKSCVCGAKGTETFSVGNALGHEMINFPAQPATCTSAGHSAYKECTRCHVREGYELFNATGHGAYNYDAAKSGASADGSVKWEAYSCEYGCGDYYMKTTITSLDANGTRVPNVNVRITGNGTTITGTTDGNGDLKIGTDYKSSLHPGRYDVYLEYVRDGGNYNTHGTITFADGKMTGSFGKLTPYGGNASGSIGGQPTGEFRCSMCDLNDSAKNKPVYGWFISIIHAFVHAISRITSR